MKVTILGSGTILSPSKRNPAGYLLEDINNFALLDCGPGILRQLDQINFNVLNLNSIFISHFHLDHCSDVFAVLMRRYLVNKNANKNLKIVGPDGLKGWFNTILKTQGTWLSQNRPVCIEIGERQINWQGILVNSHKNGHTLNSLSYLFEQRSKRFFYSGDMDFSEDILLFANHSQLAVIECSYPDTAPKPGHMTPIKLGRFVNLAKINKTVVTHIYPENDTGDLTERIKKYLSFFSKNQSIRNRINVE